MHDFSLGPPVETERNPDATHAGPCYDGVYGCHHCWSAENDGKGTISTCDSCKATEVHTRVVCGIDEPLDDRCTAFRYGDPYDHVFREYGLAPLPVGTELCDLGGGTSNQVVPTELAVASAQQVREPAHASLS